MNSVVDSVLEVFSAIADWFTEVIPTMTSLFYSGETGLTFIGVLACCGIAVGIALLVVNILRSFLSFQ